MSQNQKKNQKNSLIGFNQNYAIEGLNIFKKNLEKHFFSKVNIRDFSNDNTCIKLIIDLNCNLSIVETLHHFNIGSWGNFECEINSLATSLKTLQDSNVVHIEIEELSIFLNDTSIIINTVYDQSIPEQLENILKKIDKHYIYFTNGLMKIPYEIYVPVFEENVDQDTSLILNTCNMNNENDFYCFWGLYFLDQEEAVIYDLKTLEIVSGKLQMLNR